VPEFMRIVAIERVPAGGQELAIEAGPGERGELCRRFDILALHLLRASARVNPEHHGRRVRVEGSLEAELEQACVVTLEPVPARLEVPFERLFGEPDDAGELNQPVDELVLDATALELEPLEGGVLDLGEIVAEELALALDPYPRAPGADAELATVQRELRIEGPFAALAALRRNS
jgi:uncharacterized metal-binding protein YceD (DUF177 family)